MLVLEKTYTQGCNHVQIVWNVSGFRCNISQIALEKIHLRRVSKDLLFHEGNHYGVVHSNQDGLVRVSIGTILASVATLFRKLYVTCFLEQARALWQKCILSIHPYIHLKHL